jgi:uncharacterized protein
VGELTPIAPRERFVTLDILRGFAMLGVLLANLFSLFSYRFATHETGPGDTLDVVARWFLALTVHGRAQTLLTFLFGFGFAMQLLRARDRGQPVVPIYLRRIAALFAIGWFHVLFLSWVDVTWGYAVVGTFLILFLPCSNRTRVIVAVACTIVPAAVYAIPEVAPAIQSVLFDRPRDAYVADFAAAARSGDRLAIMHAHAMLALLWTFGGGVAWYLPWLLGRFLLGFVVGAKQWLDRDGVEHVAVFKRMLVVGGIAAAVYLTDESLQIAGVFSPRSYGLAAAMADATVEALGLIGQVAAFVAAIVLLARSPSWRRVLSIVAPVGRMPLTTYLMQSLICTTLFYGWGFNWDTPSPAACVGLGFAIFAVQIAIAHLWLRWFRFGPAEWLWRSIVYWKPQPMRIV